MEVPEAVLVAAAEAVEDLARVADPEAVSVGVEAREVALEVPAVALEVDLAAPAAGSVDLVVAVAASRRSFIACTNTLSTKMSVVLLTVEILIYRSVVVVGLRVALLPLRPPDIVDCPFIT